MRLLTIFPAIALGWVLAFGVTSFSASDAEAGGWRGKHKSGKGHSGRKHHGYRHHRHRSHHYYGYYGGYGYPYGGYRYRYGYGGYRGGHARYRYGHDSSNYVRESRVERGFRYLVEGDPKRAVTVFSKLAESDPSDALPKLGYAIAMSELQELDRGVWAMRRAIRTDPESLRNAPLDYALRPRVRALVDVYHPDEASDSGLVHSDDSHFMEAAILWVLGDDAGARSATEWAISEGDDDESTRALSEAIADRARRAEVPDIES